jgi:ABC-type antimicrobial peptide transport system permease subunit
MVNQTMAETLWPGGDALGQCLHVAEQERGGPSPCARVVGVVEDAHRFSLEEPAAMQYYVPLGHEVGFGGSRLLVRPRRDPEALAGPLRQALLPLDRNVLWLQVEPLRRALEPELRPLRLGAVLIGVLGLLALLVAALGLYSLIAHSVASRARELAVHVALGARRAAVVGLVLRGGLGLATLGLLLGVLLSLAGGSRIGSLLFHTSPRDPLVYLAVVASLLAAAAAACLLPARRALRIDPARVLRDE